MTFFGAALLTAIATAVLAAFAIVTAWYARKAFRQQAEEVSLLLEQNKRDTDERRSAQAARVFLAVDRDEVRLVSPYVRNASDLPVYDVEIRYPVSGSEQLPVEVPCTLMPGGTVPAARPPAYGSHVPRRGRGSLGALARWRSHGVELLVRQGTRSTQKAAQLHKVCADAAAGAGPAALQPRPRHQSDLPAPALVPPLLIAGAS
jgi:hypothetical protein